MRLTRTINQGLQSFIVIKGKTKGRREVMGKRGRSKQLLDDLKEKRGYWKLKDGTLDRIL